MTDDIVTRLREHHGSFRMAVGVNDAFILETIYGEAADEIERLRKENEQLRNGNNLLAAMFTGKAVRGE